MASYSTDSVDMRASLGLELDHYETKTYKPEYAVAEFVDNSVASYLKDKVFLQVLEPGFKLKIQIDYDIDRKILQITDNAGGMNRETFKSALILGKLPKDRSGLNEFGFGLKTAASWFGKKWSVRSSTFNDDSEFYALVDIKDLLKTGSNEVPITIKPVRKGDHYTIVRISDLKKTISRANISKLKEELSSMYRRFLAKNEIEITFNGEPLVYKEPECLTLIEDGVEREWKLQFDDRVDFEGISYPISGFVGLLKDGSYKVAGLTLIRRNRVIIGGYEKGFKPAEIFGAVNSPISLRFFGEINMDKWPVTQAKDDFDWEMNGLKDAFLDKIKKISGEYITKAKNYRAKASKNPITPIKVQEFADETKRNIEKMGPDSDVKIAKELPPVEVRKNDDGVDIPSVTYPLNIGGTDYKITVEYICDPECDLVVITPKVTDPTDITVSFNSTFPMFNVLNSSSTFIKVLQKFFIALVIAEEQSLRISDDGKKVQPALIRDNLNQILIKMSNDGDFGDD